MVQGVLTFLLAAGLSVLPVSGPLSFIWPDWCAVWVWLVSSRERPVSMRWVFFLGLLVDLLQATVLGQHALGYLFLNYAAIKWHRQYRHYHVIQMLVWITIMFSVNAGLQAWVMSMTQTGSSSLQVYGSIIGDVLCWRMLSYWLKSPGTARHA
jgi:rod shape-determining protein MreD